MRRRILFFLLFAIVPSNAVFADSESFSLFDIESAASGTELVVSMLPHEAFLIVRTSANEELDLARFHESGSLLTAFVEGRIQLTQNGKPCDWDAMLDTVPTELVDAYADGITVRGLVRCPKDGSPFQLETDVFTDAFPTHENVIRYKRGEAFETAMTLTAYNRIAIIRPSLAATVPELQRESSRESLLLAALTGVLLAGFAGWLWRKTKDASPR